MLQVKKEASIAVSHVGINNIIEIERMLKNVSIRQEYHDEYRC